MRLSPWGVALACVACGGNPTPEVQIVAVSPEEIDPRNDATNDVTITVRYYDGDGDLGGGVADIHDCRTVDLVTRLDIPPIANEASAGEVAIDGTLELLVADVTEVAGAGDGCMAFGVEPAGLAFCVVLEDAAGHASNAACTASLALP
jgi:hypothetical protein